MESVIFRARKEEIIPRSFGYDLVNINNLANHQNLRLLKRFDLFIDIKTQQNTICLTH